MQKEADDAANKKAKEAVEAAKAKQKAAPAPAAWSKDQQRQMEEAMREFPAEIATKERWQSIATKVEGKSPKLCYERFRELVAMAKQ